MSKSIENSFSSFAVGLGLFGATFRKLAKASMTVIIINLLLGVSIAAQATGQAPVESTAFKASPSLQQAVPGTAPARKLRMQSEANYFGTFEQDVAWFEAAEKTLPVGDTRAVFMRVYHAVTLEMPRMFAESQFQHPEWVNELMLKYVSLYRNAFDCDDLKNCEVSPAWQTAFRQNRRGKISPAGQLLLSISAHVNRDLPVALASIPSTRYADPTYLQDFNKISLIFQRRMSDLITIVQEYETCRVNPVDRKIIDGVINFAINTTREKSWKWAEKLAAVETNENENQVLKAIENHAHNEDISIYIWSPAPALAICL